LRWPIPGGRNRRPRAHDRTAFISISTKKCGGIAPSKNYYPPGIGKGKVSDRRRRKVFVDYGRWQAVIKMMRQRSKPSAVAVLVALENLCFEQRNKRGGNACVASEPYIASMSGVHEDTVGNVIEVFEQAAIVKVKRQYNVRLRKYDENHYILLTIGGANFTQTADTRTQKGEGFTHLAELERASKSVALSKKRGGAKLRPAASAGRNWEPLSGVNGGAVEPDDDDNISIKTPTAAELEAAAKAEEERLATEAREADERVKRFKEESRKADEQIKADQRAREQADLVRRQGDYRECMHELLSLLERKDFDPTDYSALLWPVKFYRPEVMQDALKSLSEPLAGRWRQAEAVMIKEKEIPGPLLS
jgi:hypothetical protein